MIHGPICSIRHVGYNKICGCLSCRVSSTVPSELINCVFMSLLVLIQYFIFTVIDKTKLY